MMNREIKFRAWHKNLKFLCFIFQINFDNRVVDLLAPDEPMYDITFDDVIFMQYTGLKDINGIEIYEGDVIKDIKSDRVYIVKFGSFMDTNYQKTPSILGWYLSGIKFYDGALFKPTISLKNFYFNFNNNCSILKVICNIYENPELIKE